MDRLNTLEHDINALTQSVLSMATVNINDKTELASQTLHLLEQASHTIQHWVSSDDRLSNNVAQSTFRVLDHTFDAAKMIIQAINNPSGVEIAAVSVQLTNKVTQVITEILAVTDTQTAVGQALAQSLNAALTDIQAASQAIASAADANDKVAIAQSSFALLDQVVSVAAKTLTEGGVLDDTTQVTTIESLAHGVLGTAHSIAGLSTENNPSLIKDLSVSLINHINDTISDALLLGQQDKNLVQGVHDAINNHVGTIGNTALQLAQADTSSQSGKVSVAVNALTLIGQSNDLVADLLHNTGLAGQESEFAQQVLDILLNSAKNVAFMAATDPNSIAGRQQIASASVQLAGQLNELSKSIQTIAGSNSQVGDALYATLKEHLSQFENLAVQLAGNNHSDATSRTELAKTSFELIAEVNHTIGDFLGKAGLVGEVSKVAGQLADSVLDTARVLTDLVQVDPMTDDGKLAIASHSFTLAQTANQMISQIMALSDTHSTFGEQFTDIAGKTLSIAQDKLISVANDVITLVHADALTPEGTRLIVDKSLALTGTFSDTFSEIIAAVGGDKVDQTGAGAAHSLIDIGRSIASLIQIDVNSTEGKAAIAENSLKLAGNVNQLVNEVLKAADLSSNISDTVSSSVGGILGNISNVVGAAMRLKDWSTMSQADQIAAGFDVGMKTVGAAANSMSIVGDSIAKFLGTTTALPQVGAALSGLALAVSPVEIKQLIDEHNHVRDIDNLGQKNALLGYEGDALLANLLQEKFALNTAYTAVNIAMNVASTAVSAAAAASVVGAPVAAIAGIVRGVVGGILTAVKQPSLEIIADRYSDQIKSYGDVEAYFDHNMQANLNRIYEDKETKTFLQYLQDSYHAKQVITIDGVASSDSSLELAAVTKLTDNMNKAENYASLIRNGELDKNSMQHLQIDAKTGILTISSSEDSVIKFNSPLFSPGQEEATRKKVGKNQYYTDLIINGPDHHLIHDGAGSNVFISDDRYASTLYDHEGNIIKSIHLEIDAGAGNDVYIADSGVTIFDGGEDIDSINYGAETIRGIVVRGQNGEGNYIVSKDIQDSAVISEHIEEKNFSYGKRTENVAYRNLSIENSSFSNADQLHNVEIISASNYDDYLYGNQDSDYFLGQNGNDHIYTYDGKDIVDGGNGNDYIDGGNGNDVIIQKDAHSSDTLIGGAGNDTLDLSELVTDADGKGVYVDLRSDSLIKGSLQDKINGFENILGSAGDDEIHGNLFDNVLAGGSGIDYLYGYSGNDVLYSSAGDNYLYGGAGNDVYLLGLEGNHHINDTEGQNIAKLLIDKQSIQLTLQHDSTNHSSTIEVNLANGNSQEITIEHTDRFGIFSLGENYTLNLDNGTINYMLAGNKAQVDFNAEQLTVNEGGELHIHATAKDNSLTLAHTHDNIINLYANTHTDINDFQQGKDKLDLSFSNLLNGQKPELTFSGHDVEGGDVHISYQNTELTLYGAGSVGNVGKDISELTAIYII